MSGAHDQLAGDAHDVARRIADGTQSAESTVGAALERARTDPFGCFEALDEEAALERARELDRARSGGASCGPLFGVPIAIKSNICVDGELTTCGSRLLAGHRSIYDATAVERLVAAGAVVVGTTRMDEFGMGSSGENCASGATTNPRTPAGGAARSPGGSSSGSAAAVAAGIVPLALGSDTGGSVRQPAAFCGVFGHKPTWGRVSRHGLVAFASSLDTIGTLARSARDLELALAVMAGPDGRDSTAFERTDLDRELAAPDARDANRPLAGLRLGVFDDSALTDVDPHVLERFTRTLERARELGAELVTVDLPHHRHGVAVYYVLAPAEASSNLARYDGVRYGRRVEAGTSLEDMMTATRTEGFGHEVTRRILLGTHVLSSGFYEAWFDRAARVRRAVADDFAAAFESVDLIATPTAPTTPFTLGEDVDPLVRYRGDALTIPASLAGLPAVSVPVDVEPGRTVGLQLIGPATADLSVLRAAAALRPDSVEATRGAAPGGSVQ
ncbi:Glutamyl-tRNA(Gln) amidotransferase subunit A [Planctomycetes bacterium Pla163]|uniref:Glutamyl-tRNA(Gln) amidotransferase subunit A n=1 Tax=Rohdeia mirabilis TaxID=2528008 RepID=A0A518D1L2_9BACT|nr:Glutamyl-tRNA(Gln) amidotransferase subunit A [Planctomycetes bacterium Pla163]